MRHIGAGDVTLIAPSVVTEREPKHHLTTTTLLADADYLIEHLFWQHLDIIPKGDAAPSLTAELYPESVKVLRVGELELEGLEAILAEFVSVTKSKQYAAGYYRTHTFLFTALEAIARYVPSAVAEVLPLPPRERAVQAGAPH